MDFFPARAETGHILSGGRTTRVGQTRALCRFFLAPLLALTLFSGCAKTDTLPDWQLSKESETIYYFLVQLEAASSGDVETFAMAGQKLLELEPDEAAFLEMAEFSVRRGRVEEARQTARKGLAVFPHSLPLTLIISDSYLQQEQITPAVDTILYYLKTNPDNQDAVQELARVYLMGERYDQFDELLGSIPPGKMTPYLHYVKARSLLNRNRLTEGEKELRRVVKEAPDMIDAWVNLGIALQLQGKHNAAIPMFRKAVDGDPENFGLWLRLVDAQIRAKRTDLALKTIHEAPPSDSFRIEAAMIFVEMKQYATARNIFQQVRDTPGAPEEVHIYLAALAMENLRNPTEALRELSAIQPHSPLAERALRWRLQILEEAGRVSEALPVAKAFAEQNADKPEFQIIHAQATGIAGDPKTSVAILREARRKWPDNVAVAFHLGSYLDMVKEREEALQLMEFVIAGEPRNAFALNYVGYTLADNDRELERAHGLLMRAMAEAPEDPHIMDSVAWVLYRQGKYDEAWEMIRKSISLGGDHTVIWEHYGDIALKLGNKTEARKGYANALKLKPDDPDILKTKLQEVR